jgi:hypothetical protein
MPLPPPVMMAVLPVKRMRHSKRTMIGPAIWPALDVNR